MKKTILLRAYTQEGLEHLKKIAALIQNKTQIQVQIIDHTQIGWDDFEVEDPAFCVSLDKHLSEVLKIPYFQVSRIFDSDGNVVGYHERGNFTHYGEKVCILDIDMIQGKAIQLACRRFSTSQYSIPILVGSTEELVNVEDLIHPLSLLQREKGGALETCTYLLNERFFSARTSLPMHLYADFLNLFQL